MDAFYMNLDLIRRRDEALAAYNSIPAEIRVLMDQADYIREFIRLNYEPFVWTTV